MRDDLPTGTVTFLFTDVEGSTKLLHGLGADGYAEALADHRRVIREACARHDGVEVDTQGDAFFVAFPTAPGALAAAAEATEALASGPIQVRMGLHTGTPLLTDEGYVGGDVHRAARIAAAGHGGQVLVSSSTAQLIELALTDLGAHRFKDLGAPERVYQLGDGEFPALKSLYCTNLPVPTTPFLGRERELAEVVGLLEGTRLLTLTGPGGTGKTRLAAQAAGMASEAYPDGVWWVPLAALRDPELVLETAAQVVGSKNGLAEHVADKSLLLLFDNFEQVVEAAGDLADVLASCPNLDLLVTSREPLHVKGEQEYPVPPLVHEEGVGFFLARARAVKPSFQPDEAVSDICRRLDDLPLALELAAARVKALSSAQILERLEERLPLLTGGARDLPERQRTLRGAIAWSYDLLSEDEQKLFARLSVFRGGCTLEAAEEICGADLDPLQSLVDKSLLRFSDERYWMLETIREFAAERLEESDEAAELSQGHAAYFLALGEEAVPHIRVDSVAWFRRLDAEHDNFRKALDTFEGSISALQLAGALYKYWNTRGHMAEGRLRLESALGADKRPTALRARALAGAGVIVANSGDPATGRRRLEEALSLYRQLGDAWGTAHVTVNLGAIAAEEDLEHAQRLFEESADAFAALGDEHWALWATRMVAFMCFERGDRARARELHEDVVRRARATGDDSMAATSLGALAEYDLYEGQVERALPMLVESTRIYRELGDPFMIAVNLCRFALGLVLDFRPVAAAQMLASAETVFREVGKSVDSWIVEMNALTRDKVRAQLDDAALAEAWEQGAKLSLDQAVALALEA
jgi:predicted ATPase